MDEYFFSSGWKLNEAFKTREREQFIKADRRFNQ